MPIRDQILSIETTDSFEKCMIHRVFTFNLMPNKRSGLSLHGKEDGVN